jgi:4-amino-4-deoxy-L-arabinose transferase-like glycosyltransferase
MTGVRLPESRRLATLTRQHWLLAAVLAAFAACAFIVPTMTPVATTDDWGYSQPVEILLDERRLVVYPVVAATAVFQIFWGALFAVWTDNRLGAVRVSTLVMACLGGLALYDICRQMLVPRSRAALGVAAYLFNPLSFILAYTFMTDPHFAALLTISTACFMRGLTGPTDRYGWMIAGSTVAAAALLVRQQGVLIPFGIALFLLLSGRLRWNRQSASRLAAVGLIPFIAGVVYATWLRWFNGVPDVQTSFAEGIIEAGWEGFSALARHLTFFELMYLGFFLLPVAAAAIVPAIFASGGFRRWWWTIPVAVTLVVVIGVTAFADTRRRMPYVPQFFGPSGLGPPDVRGSRPRIFDSSLFDPLTLVCAVSVIAASFLIVRAWQDHPRSHKERPLLIICAAVAQIAGIFPPSYHYLDRGYSLDRYFLPLLPLGLALLLWAANDWSSLFIPAGWLLVVTFAVFSVAATRDYLVFLDAVWRLANEAMTAGIPKDRIEAGAAWDGYHLYAYGLEHDITRARTRDGPWWVFFYGKATDSTYVVASEPIPGYSVAAIRSYSTWLENETHQIYLLRRSSSRWWPS